MTHAAREILVWTDGSTTNVVACPTDPAKGVRMYFPKIGHVTNDLASVAHRMMLDGKIVCRPFCGYDVIGYVITRQRVAPQLAY